jgi:hypothetical protein
VKTSAHRRRRRWLVVIGLSVVLVLSAAFAVLRIKFEGAGLADDLAALLNKQMRGRIEIGSIEWSTASLKKVITGGWVPVTVRDVRVWDDCALSSLGAGDATAQPGSADPNQDCAPDDRPDPSRSSTRKPRKLLLRTDLITVEIDIHAVMFGNHDFVFRHLWIHGGEALLEQTREPYPLHAYDRTLVSIMSAFYPRLRASFRAGIYADSPPPIFDLRDIHIEGLNLTLHMAPYGVSQAGSTGYAFTARLEGVDVDTGTDPANNSYLYMDATDPLIGKFYVRLSVAAKRGLVRINDEGPRMAFQLPAGAADFVLPRQRRARYQLALADIKLARLAQLPSAWANRDFVANTLEVDLEARALPCPDPAAPAAPPHEPTGGARLHVSGELFNYWDRPYDGAWNLKLDGKNLGPTIGTCIEPIIGGDQLDGTISLTGPFVAPPAVGLDLTGVDLRVPVRKGEEPLRLTIAELHGKIDLVNEEGYIEKTKALGDGHDPGEVDLSATFGLKPLYSNAQVEVIKAIDVGRFLPPRVAASVGKFLQGRLRAIVATDAEKPAGEDTVVELSDFDLALGPTARQKAIRLHHGRLYSDDGFASIRIEKVYVEAGRSHADLDGWVDVAKNNMDVQINGDFPDLDVWLKRFDLPALFKSAQGTGNAGGAGIRLTGPLTSPRITVTDTLLAGVPCIDKLQLGNVVKDGDRVTVARMSSPGLGGQLTGSGQFVIGRGAPKIERLDLTGAKLDAARLCGLKGVKGTIDAVDLHLHGDIDPKRTALEWLGLGQVLARADHLTIFDERYSGITACINRKDDKSCRQRPVLDPDDLKQCEDGKRAGAAGGTGFCMVAAATRDDGGTLDATIALLPGVRTGTRIAPPHLAGVLALSDLPLALIDQLRGKPASHSVGGLASLTLHLQGSPAAPQATGAIQILRSWLAGGFLGDAQIAVEPATVRGVPGLAFRGSALAGRLAITGSLGTAAPYPVELAITGRRLEVDPFIDLQALLRQDDPIQAWASGTITVRTELAPVKPVQPEVWLELTELAAQINRRASDGRITPLAIRVKDQNPGQRPAMSLFVTPSSLELACRDPKATGGRAECSTILETPAGDIVLAGHATQRSVAINASGELDLSKLRSLLDQRFDYVAGRVRLIASVGGAFAQPTFEASIDLDPDLIWQHNETERAARRAAAADRVKRPPVAFAPGENPVVLRPIGSDTVVTAPHGQVKLAYGTIGFNDVLLQIKDERHDTDEGDLHLAGTIGLAGITPVTWSLLLSGKLAGKMLQVFLPNQVAQANGLITIDGPLVLSGTGPTPALSGTLLFDHFSLIPRGVRRELSFHTGSVDIATESAGEHRMYTFDIEDVDGALDDGHLSNISGSLSVRDGEIVKTAIRLDASNLPFRIAQTLDLVLSATGVSITLDGPGANWKVGGDLTVVDGAYLRNFELTDRIQTIGLNSAPSKPFWEEYPTLGSAELDLRLVVQLFAVRNNVATIAFHSDNMRITGSPRDPRLSGSILVTHGEFRIPGTRAEFIRTTGTVDFAENQPANNPDLHVSSDADYRDLSGQDHVITVTIGGSLQLPTWDLRTSTGYNKSQTLWLLVLGRNQEQLRRSLGDQNLGGDPTRADPTTNPSQGFADQIVKDLAGDWVSGLLGSSLTKLTGLDVLRIEIGFGSIGFHVEKKILENAKLLGDAEQTIRGTTIKALAELKTPFVISLQGGYLNQNYYDPAEQDIKDYNVKLVYRVFIP